MGGLPWALSGAAVVNEILRGWPSVSSLCSSLPCGTSAGPSSTLAYFCARSIWASMSAFLHQHGRAGLLALVQKKSSVRQAQVDRLKASSTAIVAMGLLSVGVA